MVSAGFLIESAGKFLICHSSSLDGKLSYTDQMWGIPKGIVEKNESVLEAAMRETLEETGVDIHKLHSSGYVKIVEDFFRYKTTKKKVYVSYANCALNITKEKRICRSMIMPFNIPENDFFVWVDWNVAKEMVSKNQKALFSDENFERLKKCV